MISQLKKLFSKTNSPVQHIRKCLENSKEIIYNDVRVKSGEVIHVILMPSRNRGLTH